MANQYIQGKTNGGNFIKYTPNGGSNSRFQIDKVKNIVGQPVDFIDSCPLGNNYTYNLTITPELVYKTVEYWECDYTE